jgi:DNA-binding transcriptional LysR family regulator
MMRIACAKIPEKSMEWDDLRIFLQVARSGQMTSASRALGVDHSTISRRIVRLEEQLNVTLFDRAGKRLRMTEEGKKLLSATETLESVILRDVMNLNESSATISGHVRIGTMEGFGALYLAPRLPKLLQDHPELDIELVALPRSYSLASREVDLAITVNRPATGSVRFKKLTPVTLGIYGSKSYFEKHKKPESLEDLKRHLWCGYIMDLLFTEELYFLKFEETVIQPRYRTTSSIVQMEAICAGSVIGVLPCFMAKQRSNLERILPQQVSIERSFWLSLHEDLGNLFRVRFVMEEIERLVMRDRNLFQSD